MVFICKVEYPSPKDVLCQVWLKLALWFWRRRFLNFVNFFFALFCNYLPLNRAWPFIWINLNPFHPRMFYAKFGWNWPSGSREEVEDVKFTDWQMPDNRCSEKLTWAFSSGEPRSVFPIRWWNFKNFCLWIKRGSCIWADCEGPFYNDSWQLNLIVDRHILILKRYKYYSVYSVVWNTDIKHDIYLEYLFNVAV